MGQYFDLVLSLVVMFVGLAALVGGLRKKPNPFFWMKNPDNPILKTPTHYILFGAITVALALFLFVKSLASTGLF